MTEFHFHCVWSVSDLRFVITMEHTRRFLLTPDEFKAMLDDADAQVTAQGTGFGNFILKLPQGVELRLTGVGFTNILSYLKRVYDGWNTFTFARDGQNKGKAHA
jgi:hypothetical protein